MKVYTTDKIRNVVLLGHGGSGKTSLAEAFAYLSGITSRMGKVSDGNTLSDYSKEEQKRKFSINASIIPIEWEGYKINVIDTPGYFDFVGEAEEAVSAAGAAIIVVNGKSGIEVGTQKAWELCEKYKLPTMPIRHPSPTVQLWRMAPWPTTTFSPTTVGTSTAQWTVQLSWILLPRPIRMGPTSPRRTAPYQMVTFSSRATSPITAAVSASRAEG